VLEVTFAEGVRYSKLSKWTAVPGFFFASAGVVRKTRARQRTLISSLSVISEGKVKVTSITVPSQRGASV
jgi:hypothetical protein